MEYTAVGSTGRKQRHVEGMPGQGRDVLLVTSEEADVPHHAQVEDSSGLVPSTGR